jgi:tryptophanyl-tRNA synthetase
MVSNNKQKRILTGDTPTGKLHLGHYVGSIENRLKLQNEYDTFIICADMHSFAYPKYVEDPKTVAQAVWDVTADNLAAGLDPDKVKFFTESSIPEIYELAAMFSMLVTHARAMRNPTLKEEILVKDMGENYSLGFINFPIYQAADILCVNADLVPVGEDQAPHLELTREVARKFNQTYGKVFVESEALIGRVKRLVGLDGGAKMSKSLNNTIYLSEPRESLRKKVMSMYTDPSRVHPTDPGNVEGNPVFVYHDAFNQNKDEVDDLKARYLIGKVGDVEVKEKLFAALDTFLEPIRERRVKYEKTPDLVYDILQHGSKIAREESQRILSEAKERMKLVKAGK